MTIRTHTHLQVKAGVTLQKILDAFVPFFIEFGLVLAEAAPGEFAGEASEDMGESFVILDSDGSASFNVSCRASGYGDKPQKFDELCDRLRPLIQGGGVIEIIDHDIGAANAASVSRVYLAPEGQEAANDELEIALALCAVELHSVIGTAGVEVIEAQIRAMATRTGCSLAAMDSIATKPHHRRCV